MFFRSASMTSHRSVVNRFPGLNSSDTFHSTFGSDARGSCGILLITRNSSGKVAGTGFTFFATGLYFLNTPTDSLVLISERLRVPTGRYFAILGSASIDIRLLASATGIVMTGTSWNQDSAGGPFP